MYTTQALCLPDIRAGYVCACMFVPLLKSEFLFRFPYTRSLSIATHSVQSSFDLLQHLMAYLHGNGGCISSVSSGLTFIRFHLLRMDGPDKHGSSAVINCNAVKREESILGNCAQTPQLQTVVSLTSMPSIFQ